MGCCCFWLYVVGAVAVAILLLTAISPTAKYHIKYVGLCLAYINLTVWCGVFALFNPRSAKVRFYQSLINATELNKMPDIAPFMKDVFLTSSDVIKNDVGHQSINININNL